MYVLYARDRALRVSYSGKGIYSMKKFVAAVLALVLLVSAALPALAQDEVYVFEGFVIEVSEDGFLMRDKERGNVFMNVDELTSWDGILIDNPIEAGMYVFAEYDGMTTRSIPPQAHADKVGCYVLNGTAGEMLPDGVLLKDDAIFGDVYVRLAPDAEHVYPDVPMTVYYNGVMALSMPAQASAAAVLVPVFEGVIDEILDDKSGFALVTASGESVNVRVDERTIIGRLAVRDASGILSENEEAEPDTEAIKGLDGDWTVENESPYAYEFLDFDALAEGGRVKVYYSGELDESGAVLAFEVQLDVSGNAE